MLTLAFASIKGGVGKTTMAVHIAAGLADMGKRTLLVDLDPQGHATAMAGVELEGDEPTVADAFGMHPRKKLSQVLQQSPRKNLWVAPAGPRMTILERELYRWGHRLQALTRATATLQEPFEALVIDTPPQLNAYTEAALATGDLVVVPVPAMAHALQGVDEIYNAWVDARDGRKARMIGAVNLWDVRTTATNKAMDQAFSELPVKLAKNRIPRVEALNQAGLGFELIYEYAASSVGAKQFKALVRELWRKAKTI